VSIAKMIPTLQQAVVLGSKSPTKFPGISLDFSTMLSRHGPSLAEPPVNGAVTNFKITY
jgi:hypothetical protein